MCVCLCLCVCAALLARLSVPVFFATHRLLWARACSRIALERAWPPRSAVAHRSPRRPGFSARLQCDRGVYGTGTRATGRSVKALQLGLTPPVDLRRSSGTRGAAANKSVCVCMCEWGTAFVIVRVFVCVVVLCCVVFCCVVL